MRLEAATKNRVTVDEIFVNNTSRFSVTNAQWNYIPSNVMGAPAGEMRRTNRRSAIIKCNDCNHGWNATSGRGHGQFSEVIGGVVVTCPNCGARGQVPDSEFM
jgi:hypothetical protein